MTYFAFIHSNQKGDYNMTNQPTHHVYHVTEKQVGDKGYWTKIGAVWPHKGGKGFNVELELIPVSSDGD